MQVGLTPDKINMNVSLVMVVKIDQLGKINLYVSEARLCKSCENNHLNHASHVSHANHAEAITRPRRLLSFVRDCESFARH